MFILSLVYYIGYDVGSSSVKASLVSSESGKMIDVVSEPSTEMEILAPRPGWAEQDPELWWQCACKTTRKILSQNNIRPDQILGVGIAYQMHGLVLISENGELLRNSIIWCDGRAVEIGNKAYKEFGEVKSMKQLLNSPGNFTASKLKWVRENEPELYKKIHKFMLPGDYIAYRFSGEFSTTVPGLSEGMFWDFHTHQPAYDLFDQLGLDKEHIPALVPTFSEQCRISEKGASESGLAIGTPILYRAGDQPNNALSLNVMEPGEVAATAGTSGVFYAVTDNPLAFPNSGVNNFAHVNYSKGRPRIGKLLCINGAGILYRWLRNQLAVNTYEEMNVLASEVGIGSEGIFIFPFGNGPERMLGNQQLNATIVGIDFNSHSVPHLIRGGLEGIAHAFAYGMELLQSEGIRPTVIRAGNDNLFQVPLFGQTIANLIDQEIEIYNNTGATGAARACVLHKGDFADYGKQVEQQDFEMRYEPDRESNEHKDAYALWRQKLETILKTD